MMALEPLFFILFIVGMVMAAYLVKVILCALCPRFKRFMDKLEAAPDDEMEKDVVSNSPLYLPRRCAKYLPYRPQGTYKISITSKGARTTTPYQKESPYLRQQIQAMSEARSPRINIFILPRALKFRK